ncbi:MAG: GNAT family N-acetyltransferase [Fimbriimonadaceae bacterium]|nr:GNAT family N-acetyltransferase [Fimbriimonadaceae bacterium]
MRSSRTETVRLGVPQQEFCLRPARRADLATLVFIFAESIMHLSVDHYGPSQRRAWGEAMSLARMSESLQRDAVWVAAESHDRAVGFICLSVENMEIDLLYLLPSVAGIGLGKALLRLAEEEASLLGVTHLRLVSSLNALAFYQSQGYLEGEHLSRRVSGMELPCVQMHKTLSQV